MWWAQAGNRNLSFRKCIYLKMTETISKNLLNLWISGLTSLRIQLRTMLHMQIEFDKTQINLNFIREIIFYNLPL